ncbi:MAG: hypothetical protein Ct9H300mP25_00460 [Acidobacteriota bacterium]|nr:MAG: hypothetical protein Ct9H300mP25_00460 [Acidobacteriota bacterium]
MIFGVHGSGQILNSRYARYSRSIRLLMCLLTIPFSIRSIASTKCCKCQLGNYWGGRTWEQDGYTAHVRGIFDEQARLMVLKNWNTDLGDAWEWAERPEYPLKYSTFASNWA